MKGNLIQKGARVLWPLLFGLAFARPALATDPPQYTGTLSVTAANGTKQFVNNRSGGDGAAFLARSVTVTATGNTCFLDLGDTLANSVATASVLPVATVADHPIVAGTPYTVNLGDGYNAPAGWGGLAGICSGGQTATWTITADRYEQPDISITGGSPAGSDGNIQVKSGSGFAAYAGSSACSAGDFVTTLSASGAATCGTPAASSVLPLVLSNSGAGNGSWTFNKTITGGGTSSNYETFAATAPALTGTSFGSTNTITLASESAAQVFHGWRFTLAGASTGATQKLALGAFNTNTGTGTSYLTDSVNEGLRGDTLGTTTGTNVGARMMARGGDVNIGGLGWALGTKNSAKNIGLFGAAANGGSSPVIVGGYFWFGTSEPTISTSAALIANNGAAALDIFRAEDNGTAKVTIADGGQATFATGVTDSSLTSGRVTFAGTGGDLSDDSDMTFATDTLTVTKIAGTNFTGTNTQTAGNYVLNTGLAFVVGTTAGSVGSLSFQTANTPDTNWLATGTTSNAWHIGEAADVSGDLNNCSAGTSASTHPILCIHSNDGASTTKWMDFKHDGTNGVIDVGTGQVRFPDSVTIEGGTTMQQSIQVSGFTYFVGGDTSSYGGLGMRAESTPDAAMLYVGTVSRSMHFRGVGQATTDANNGLCGTVACTHPAFIVEGTTPSTTEWNHINVLGSHGGNVTALTDNTATTFMHTPTISNNGDVYAGVGTYTVKVVNAGGETQTATGTFEWYAQRANTGGTVCGIQNAGNDGVLPGLPLKVVSSGTLAITLDCNVATNVASFRMTADTSLTATTFNMYTQAGVRVGVAEMILD